MKNRAVVCLAALLLSGSGVNAAWADEASPDVLSAARQRGSVEVAVYAEYPPFSDGKSTADARGIDVDIARAIAQGLGLKLKLRLISAGESVSDDLRNHVWKGHYLGGGVADVMLHVGSDPVFAGREKNVIIFEPYFHDAVTLVYKKSRIAHVESPISLTEHKIGVEGDTISDHILSSAYGGALRGSAVREKSLAEAVAALQAGEVDAVMGPQGELQGLLKEYHVEDVAFRPQEAVGQMHTAWNSGVAVKDEGGASLRDAVAGIMEGLKSSGAMQKIFAGYGVRYLDAT